MRETLAQARTLAVACADAPAWSLSDSDVVNALEVVRQLEQAVAAVELHLVRQVEVRGIHTAHHHRTCASWVHDRLRVGAGTARRLVELAGAVDSRPGLDRAIVDGSVTIEQAAAIVDTLTSMPREVAPEIVDQAESLMVDWAAEFDPQAMRKLGGRILTHVAPDLADEIEGAALARAEARAYAGRTITLSPVGDGRVRVAGYLDAEAAATVNAALDPLCAPRHATTISEAPSTGAAGGPAGSRTGGPIGSETGGPAGSKVGGPAGSKVGGPAGSMAGSKVGGMAGSETGGPAGNQTGGPAGSEAGGPAASAVRAVEAAVDERSPGQRRADALVEVCRIALHTGELPANGGGRPQVNVTIGLHELRRQVGAGTLDTGERLTASQARRLACDAHVLPAVLDGAGRVLDVGRSRRLITGALRRALVLRDRGCCFPGCDRPPRWTDGHHVRHWVDGGPTSLDNSVLLCRRHHRVVHHGDWQVRIGSDGLPEFLPPVHLDPHRRPRRNVYHRRR